MLDNSILDTLPDKERKIYEQLKLLPQPEKGLLQKLIAEVDKNGIALHAEKNEIIYSLITKQFVSINESYRGNGYSFFILPEAPYLLRELRCYSHKNNKKADWKDRMRRLLNK